MPKARSVLSKAKELYQRVILSEANDYRDVGGRKRREPVFENLSQKKHRFFIFVQDVLMPWSTGMCEKGAAYGSIQNDEERLASRMTGLYVMPKLLPLVILEAA